MAAPKQSNKPNIVVFIADGSEDVETVTVIDVLRRTQNVNLIVATVGGKSQITASRETKIVGDSTLEDVLKMNKKFDMAVLPGGMPGATNLYNDKKLIQFISDNLSNPKFILAAICASPAVVLSQSGLLKNLPATCYPAAKFKQLLKENGVQYKTDRVVIAESASKSLIVTSQGPGTALEFSFVLVQLLFGYKAANTIANAMLVLFDTKYEKQISEWKKKT
eukprot:CAMPEP_0202713464 /NCGR_PEP_ID=MMETSP1385-20130828/54499_1 /ASSEMBLY_ACC=CAM_ASM_000861 /TAXON_ID=933848 /ORGANISM="Elphidium margaritaceum" /LENGTH=220 /DNA_ID=CAMNT_0049373821 /DNA_START=18 /DNA_END=680 /DNA_ORIENTATION=-